MRVLFTGGGTGGHVYPALAVVAQLRRDAAQTRTGIDLAWVGRPDSIEQQIVSRDGLPYFAIRTGALRGRSPLQAIRSLFSLLAGIVQGWRLLGRWKADAVFSTGGYVTAPLTLAAWLRRIPVMIYLPDMEPGMAVRLLGRFARRIAVSFAPVAGYFDRRKVVVTGYPVRHDLFTAERAQARARLGLDTELPAVLVLGGSSGARSINRAVSDHLGSLLDLAQVVHISGTAEVEALAEQAATLTLERSERYHLYGYLHEEMVDALVSADLVVARAGAATLAEFPAVGLPAILVPYPHAGQHQHVNAQFLEREGGAVIVPDSELDARLLSTVEELLSDGPRLARMSDAMSRLSMPDAAARLAGDLRVLAEGHNG